MSARYGTGGNNVPLVEQDTSVYCIVGNAIDRQPQNGGNGCGYQENIAYTLTATDHHAIAELYQETVGALCRGDEKGAGNQYVSQNKCIVNPPTAKVGLLIRRLTPLECERLQGFPDGWTNIPGASDSARYKALGNSVAIPCVEYVMRGIAIALQTGRRRQGRIVRLRVAGQPECLAAHFLHHKEFPDFWRLDVCLCRPVISAFRSHLFLAYHSDNIARTVFTFGKDIRLRLVAYAFCFANFTKNMGLNMGAFRISQV